MPGQTATFSVAATGTTPLSYQWRKNGTAISGATSSSYSTAATSSSDNGAQFTVVVSNTAGSATSNAATLTVDAQPQISVVPASVSFGNVVMGTSNTQTIVLTNSGSANLTVSQAPVSGNGFSTSGLTLPLTLSPGQSANFNVAFAPAGGGSVSGSVSLVSNARNSPLAISLSGTGTAATFLLVANPTSLDFGSVNLGSSSPLSATLTNNGNSTATISRVTVSGTGFSASGVSAGTTLATNQSVNLNVAFAPAAAGNVSGSVSVASNATNSPTTVALSGTGLSITETIYDNRDLSTADLSQWTHRDYGLGTDVGSNDSGAGYLWYHSNVGGRRAVGITATPTAHASPAPNSDSVYLWEPTRYWNHQPYEIWLRTSVMFPSAATILTSGAVGELPFQPATGEWNWFLEFHDDSNPKPSCAREKANISFDVKTDDLVQSGVVGTRNVRMALRIMGGDTCAPNIVWVDGPPLQWDHWYEILLHIKWSPGSGIVEWYLDDFSTSYYSNLNIPTLFTRPTGYVSPSYTSLTLANYRLHAPWTSTIYLGPLVVGSTRSSVLDAF